MVRDRHKPKVLIAAGGGHITEVEMIKGLRGIGVDIHAALESSSPHLETLKAAGVPSRTLDLKNNIDFVKARQIRGWIRNERFDVVHGLANRQIANFIWASYGLPNKLIAYRGAVGHVSRWDPTCYIKWINPRVNRIICVSKAVERDLAASGIGSRKLITIYKGHDLSWYDKLDGEAARGEVNEMFSIPENATLIGMAANMRPVKGADLLLKAMLELPEKVHALLIGEVRDPQLEKLAADKRVQGRIHFTGFQPDAPRLIGALDINTAPSRGREGLTKTVIEGMVQRIPAVVSNAGGLPELIRDGESGYVVAKDDLTAFRDRINELVQNPTIRTRMGENARDDIQRRFNVNATIRQTADLYQTLLEDE